MHSGSQRIIPLHLEAVYAVSEVKVSNSYKNFMLSVIVERRSHHIIILGLNMSSKSQNAATTYMSFTKL